MVGIFSGSLSIHVSKPPVGQKLECYAMTADFLSVQEYEYKISATWKKLGGDGRHILAQSYFSCIGRLRTVQQGEQEISHLREFL